MAGTDPAARAADLPGWLARRLERPLPRPSARASGAPELSYGRHRMPPVPDSRLASVLVLFYPLDGEWAVPLTLRPRSLALHAGQISLPGGRVDDGETFEQAALREFQEELGVTIDAAELLGRLSPIYVYNSNHYAVPCVAAVRQRPVFRPNAAEVARVLEVPVREMLNPGRRGWHWIRRGPLRYRAPHIGWQGARIWGATRIILGELIALLEER